MSHKCPCIAYEKIMEIVWEFRWFSRKVLEKIWGKKLGPRPGDSLLLRQMLGGSEDHPLFCKWASTSMVAITIDGRNPAPVEVGSLSHYVTTLKNRIQVVQAGLQKKSAVCRFAKFVNNMFFFLECFQHEPQVLQQRSINYTFLGDQINTSFEGFPLWECILLGWKYNDLLYWQKIGHEPFLVDVFFRDTLLGKIKYPLAAGTFESMVFLFVRWGGCCCQQLMVQKFPKEPPGMCVSLCKSWGIFTNLTWFWNRRISEPVRCLSPPSIPPPRLEGPSVGRLKFGRRQFPRKVTKQPF